MKRDIFIKSQFLKQMLNWFISFLISMAIFIVLLLLFSLIQLKSMFGEQIVRIVLVSMYSGMCIVCAYIYCCLSKIKGLFCGLITAGIFCLIKLLMSMLSGGVGKENFIIYICLCAAGMLGGILAANRKTSSQKRLVKLNKSI